MTRRRDLTTMEWIRAAAQRISCGSGRLCWLIARRITSRGAARARAWWAGVTGWLAEAAGLAWLLRLGLLIGAGLIARKLLLNVGRSIGNAHAPEGLMWVLALVWLITSYRIGRPDWQPPAEPEPETEQVPAEETEKRDEDAEDEPAAEPPARPAPPTLAQLRAAVAEIGTPHAHVAVLAEHLGTTADLVREGLVVAGIPVDAVRMKGRGSSTGVRAEDLPPPSGSSSAAPEGVVGTGQSANNDNNNAPTDPAEKGLRVERIGQSGMVMRDPAETVSRRHAV
ncbi:hypothetical protein [Streptomyces sp. DASNCL29]|uniref:hypothetical protein n=1 Tax=Streptomyces sp. DASNCL29 TaxID=2583819 RepID=UPI00110F83A7|nr:hypothetical protein [Streptomyces sp. DASNCL29]TMU98083.1 hypothetical protein FGK60_09650 [Streptomyces sp. DASNCL29]